MKNAVFMGVDTPINEVYSDAVKEKLFAEFFFPTKDIIKSDKLDEYREVLEKTDYIFSTWGMPCLTEEQIRGYLPNLKAVFYGAGTVQRFARPFLACGVKIFSAWAANAVPVSEYTFAAIIMAAKGYFHRLHRQSGGAAWSHRDVPVAFPGNYEIKVGIIGAGMIGKLVIGKLKNTLERIEVLVFDPFLPDEKAEALGVKKVSLETLFAESDVISNHLADNAQTKGMLDYHLFSLMKKGSTFINTGRGAQVVEDDMIRALREEGTYRMAVLDVTEPEPPMPDSPLYTLDNVFLTPHIAGSLGNEHHRMSEFMYEEAAAFDKGLPTRYEVTAKMLETMA